MPMLACTKFIIWYFILNFDFTNLKIKFAINSVINYIIYKQLQLFTNTITLIIYKHYLPYLQL